MAARGLRVIAGEAGGRRLVAPPGEVVRPTSDRVKESLFSALGPDRLEGAGVLDLYAGTGALAIEALSRGARRALLVERDPAAVASIVTNLAATGLAGRARVERGDVAFVLRRPAPPEAPFDLVFADPPYRLGDSDLASVLAAAMVWAAPSGTLVLERSGNAGPPDLPDGWVSTWDRCYGDTLVLFAQQEV